MAIRECRMYIDGRSTTGNEDGWIDVLNPATAQCVARAPVAGEQAVQRAVGAARAALPAWRATNPFERARYLHAIAEHIEAAERQIAVAITEEMGKPLAEALGEVRKLGKAFHYYAEEAVRVFGSTIPNEEDGFTSIVEREPVGVVAAISPWNYPVELIGWKLAAALAAGCTIVVKPSEYTPSCAEALFRCIDAARVPAGVANMITGARDTGRLLVGHPHIDKVALTGSQAAGADVFRTVQGITTMSLELGGNCPIVVTAHANLERAVTGSLRRAFRNAGQICIAINRAYVHESLYSAYIEALAERAAQLVVADGLTHEQADVGPLATPAVLHKVEQHVSDARERGARALCGGTRPTDLGAGFYYLPTVLSDCTPEMLVMREETFGPVIGVSSFSSLEDAIDLANGTPYGLAAYVYTENLRETFVLSHALDFGNVAVNNVDAGIINAPYGGRKQSGMGYEHGSEGLAGYLQFKHIRVHHGT